MPIASSEPHPLYGKFHDPPIKIYLAHSSLAVGQFHSLGKLPFIAMAFTSTNSDSSLSNILPSITEDDPNTDHTASAAVPERMSRPLPCVQRLCSIQDSQAVYQTHEISPARVISASSDATSRSLLSRSLRSPSASSLWYHMKKLPMGDTIPLGASVDPALVKEFLDLAEKRAEAFKSNVHRTRTFQVFWYLLVSCMIYFGFVGLPLWNGIVFSI